ncbi:TetR family transcriptional regulator [Stieleria sp. ICT_E10.1]|uniref:TetR/AcrR family transcriptional regulator n=1 Tax=Stieleria sedimenti TaxID=2976331 RepID=UPI0021800C88|nr:TetR family transcriptional regulator [Stieleria sedimenti]MCS7467438.1 TetR family transcriptional regulator [Stieleria sedimenti]
MNWQRARRPEQKAERISAILDAAAELFDDNEFDTISMRDVANHAGLGKASLYHYFKTKEEVFLTLYREELGRWLESVTTGLGRLRKPTPKRVAEVLTSALQRHERFCRLKVLFASVLERNLSPDFLIEYKRSLVGPVEAFAATIKSVTPHFSSADAKAFAFQHHALVAGLWPIANPSPQVESVLQAFEFQGFRTEFAPLLTRTFVNLLSPID